MNLTGKYQKESFYIYEKNLSIFYFFKGFSSSTRLTNLWRASMDGFEADRFHSKCNNQGKTLTVVKTKSGYIMGGYTAVPWTSPEDFGILPGYRNDSTAFLFTLVNPMRRPLKLPIISSNSQYATRHVSTNGPIFGNGFDLFISNNCYNNENSYSSIRTYTSPKNLSGSEDGRWMPNSFSCEDIEVFRVDE